MMRLLMSVCLLLSFCFPAWADITANIQLCLNFENADKGIDDSANAYNMTTNGTVTQITGKVGSYGISCAAGTDKLSTTGTAAPNLDFTTNSFTFSVWVSTPEFSGLEDFYRKRSGSANGYVFSLNGGLVRIIRDGGGASTDQSTGNIENSGWKHVMAVYDSTVPEIRFYIDGALDSGSPISTTAYNVSGGIDNIYVCEAFNYSMDQLILYNDAKVLADAQALYNSGSGTDPCNPAPPPAPAFTPQTIITKLLSGLPLTQPLFAKG